MNFKKSQGNSYKFKQKIVLVILESLYFNVEEACLNFEDVLFYLKGVKLAENSD